jgi:Ca2+:H+ antiporter
MLRDHLPFWTWLGPLAGWLLLAASLVLAHPSFDLALGAGLVACVLAAVHHAEVVAHRVGEPFGTLVLPSPLP